MMPSLVAVELLRITGVVLTVNKDARRGTGLLNGAVPQWLTGGKRIPNSVMRGKVRHPRTSRF